MSIYRGDAYFILEWMDKCNVQTNMLCWAYIGAFMSCIWKRETQVIHFDLH